jgi:hypothetical protein
MRLVTANCNKGAFSRKVPLLERMLADIAVIQECAKPIGESNRCLWFSDASGPVKKNPDRAGSAKESSDTHQIATAILIDKKQRT